MNSIISWIGGKKSLRKMIYERFPKSYGRYIEVFGGGGWILFGKQPERDLEVYNDFNGNLANLFSVVRDQPLAFIKELGYLPLNSRSIFNLYKEIIQLQRIEDTYVDNELELSKIYFTELQYEELKEIYTKHTEMQDVRLAAIFFKLIRYSYGSSCDSYSCKGYDVRKIFAQIWRASDRLANTVIENKDFEALINQYDRDDAFFYLDPPYYTTEGMYEVVFTKEDHVRLRDTLKNIKGKFLLSYNDCEYIRELYKDFYIESTTRINNLAIRYDNSSEFAELIISNYDTKKEAGCISQIALFD